MIPAEMVMGFLSAAKSNNKRVKITVAGEGVFKGKMQDVKMEDKVITIDLEGKQIVMDMNVCEAKTSFFDHRVIYVQGEEQYKLQLG